MSAYGDCLRVWDKLRRHSSSKTSSGDSSSSTPSESCT